MEKTAEYSWDALEKCFEKDIHPKYPEIEFNKIKKEQFKRTFCESYKYVKAKYMTEDTECLDRHKQAAILICCVLKEDILVSQKIPEGKEFVGKYSLALSLGLAFMLDRLKERFDETGIEEEINDLTDIIAFACPTNYFDVLFRNLYFEEKEQGSVFVLTLANTLFLLEYIALMKKNIPFEKLREYNDDGTEKEI